MSRVCAIIGKKANFGHSRSHSNIATKRRQHVNLQTIRIGGTRMRLSTEAIKTLKRMAAIAHGEIPTKRQKKAAKTAARLARAS